MIQFRSLLASLAIGGVLLSGCLPTQSTVRDKDGAITEANEHASVFEMKVGDCYQEPPEITEAGAEFETLPAVPCSDEHDLEVYAESTLKDRTFPDEDELIDKTFTLCEQEFEPFVGVPYDESELDVVYFYPLAESWAQGDRAISCLVSDPEGPVTGTLKNSRR